jgi:hypothetical protein
MVTPKYASGIQQARDDEVFEVHGHTSVCIFCILPTRNDENLGSSRRVGISPWSECEHPWPVKVDQASPCHADTKFGHFPDKPASH